MGLRLSKYTELTVRLHTTGPVYAATSTKKSHTVNSALDLEMMMHGVQSEMTGGSQTLDRMHTPTSSV